VVILLTTPPGDQRGGGIGAQSDLSTLDPDQDAGH
jgi:hypothetical protein